MPLNEANHVRFVHVDNHLWSLMRRPRRNFESQLASKLKDIVKPFWRYVNSQIKTKAVIDDLKRPDGSLMSSNESKGDILANSFANVFVLEHCSVIPGFASQWNGPFLEELKVTPLLVERTLHVLKTSTSLGPDQISSRVLRELAKPLSVPVCSLF